MTDRLRGLARVVGSCVIGAMARATLWGTAGGEWQLFAATGVMRPDIWPGIVRETGPGARCQRQPFPKAEIKWGATDHSGLCQQEIVLSTPRIRLLPHHSVRGPLPYLEGEGCQGDHHQWRNADMLRGGRGKHPHKNWKLGQHWGASSAQKNTELWPASRLWCHQSPRWCSHNADGGSTVSGEDPGVRSAEDRPARL